MLKLTREGTSGLASIKWGILGSASITAGDTGPTSGTVTMDAGKFNQISGYIYNYIMNILAFSVGIYHMVSMEYTVHGNKCSKIM